MRFFILFCLAILGPVSSLGKTTLNSRCYALEQNGGKVQGIRAEELFEIASVSKIVTSYWALSQLGPSFRFITQVHVNLVSKGLYDVHIQGGRDPFWGRQLTHLLFAELNRRGVTAIRHLSFDENLLFRWHVLTDFIHPLNPSPAEIAAAFKNHLRDLAVEYPRTRREALASHMKLPATLSLTAASVFYQKSTDFQKDAQTSSFIIKSAPLYRYLKEVNTVSNNHVADKIFDYLGGASSFKSFSHMDFPEDAANIEFLNGSGNAIGLADGSGSILKSYNKASCGAIVRILIKLRELLRAQSSILELKDLLAVSGADDSTLNPRYASIPNTLIAKTGTVDPAITIGGMASTAQGEVFFGVFMSTLGPGDWSHARDLVRNSVFEIIDQHGGGKRFAYTPQPFLPFDHDSLSSSSALRQELLP